MVETLRRHLVDGRLDLVTFEDRVSIVLAARTTGEAEAAFGDLPRLAPTTSPAGRRRGRRSQGSPGPGWRPTDEVFRDPTSRQITRVWIDPADGSRHYLPD